MKLLKNIKTSVYCIFKQFDALRVKNIISLLFGIISVLLAIFSIILVKNNYFFIRYEINSIFEGIYSDSFILFLDFSEVINKLFLQYSSISNFSKFSVCVVIIGLIVSIISLAYSFINSKNKKIIFFINIIPSVYIIIIIIFFSKLGMCLITEPFEELLQERMVENLSYFEYVSNNYELSKNIRKEYFTWDDSDINEENNINSNNNNNNNKNLGVISLNVKPTEMTYLFPKNCCFYYNGLSCKLPNNGKITIKNNGNLGQYLLKGAYFDVPPMFKLVNWKDNINTGEIAIRIKVVNEENDFYIDVCNQSESWNIHIPNKESIELQYEVQFKPQFEDISCFVSFPIYWNIDFY